MKTLWLDDIRDPVKYGVPDAVWVKDADQFLNALLMLVLDEKMNELEEVHFDNDLGEGSEGYSMFVYLEEALHKGSFKNLKRIYVHSSNPSAVHKFMLASRALKYHFDIDLIRRPL